MTLDGTTDRDEEAPLFVPFSRVSLINLPPPLPIDTPSVSSVGDSVPPLPGSVSVAMDRGRGVSCAIPQSLGDPFVSSSPPVSCECKGVPSCPCRCGGRGGTRTDSGEEGFVNDSGTESELLRSGRIRHPLNGNQHLMAHAADDEERRSPLSRVSPLEVATESVATPAKRPFRVRPSGSDSLGDSPAHPQTRRPLRPSSMARWMDSVFFQAQTSRGSFVAEQSNWHAPLAHCAFGVWAQVIQVMRWMGTRSQ